MSRAVRSGDRRAILQALQQRLAKELEEASTREVPALAGRLMEVMAKLEELSAGDPAAKPVEPTAEQKRADEVARKRSRRAADQARRAV